MKRESRNSSTSPRKAIKAGKTAQRRIDLSGVKLVGPYGRDPHALESLSEIAQKIGTSKSGLRSVETKQVRRRPEKQAEAGKGAKRIDLSATKLVGPYGRDLHELESLSAVATKTGATKGGLRSLDEAKEARSNSGKKGKAAASAGKRQRIDLSRVKLVAPYGRDPHALESLSEIARKMGTSKPGLRSVETKQARRSPEQRGKAGKRGNVWRPDTSATKLGASNIASQD